MSQRAVLLLGNTSAAVTLARDLKREGYKLICSVEGEEGGAEHSRDVDELWGHRPVAGDPEGFLRDLEAVLRERPEISVVYPVSDAFLQVLVTHRNSLPAGPVYAMPPADLVNAAADRLNLLSLAVLNQVPTEPFEMVETPAAFLQAVQRIGLPLVVYPARAGAARTGEVCETLADLQTAVHGLSGSMWPLVLQRKGRGRCHCITFAAQNGALVRYGEMAIVRTDRTKGWGKPVEGKTVQPTRSLQRHLERLTKAMSYTGAGCARFLVNEADGTLSFLDLSAHIPADLAVSEASGLKLSTLAISLAQHPHDRVPYREGKVGIHAVSSAEDLNAAKRAYLQGEVSAAESLSWVCEAVSAAVRADIHLAWSWRDPLPGVFALVEILPSLQGTLRWMWQWQRLGPKVWHGS